MVQEGLPCARLMTSSSRRYINVRYVLLLLANSENGSSARSPNYGKNGVQSQVALEPDDMFIRKPTRLESLPAASGKSGKKKR